MEEDRDQRPSFRRPPTAQEAVLAELRRSILQGDLQPGTPIRQDAIAMSLGVSRVPVREALKILEGEGQVSYQPHRGFLVAELSFEEVGEVYHLRQLLEEEAIRLAVPRLQESHIEAMVATEDQLEQASSDLGTMAMRNRRFHFVLFEAAGMPRMMHHIRMLWDSSDAYRARYYMDEAQHQRVHKEHQLILEAARDRDAERLIAVHATHREGALEFMASNLPRVRG